MHLTLNKRFDPSYVLLNMIDPFFLTTLLKLKLFTRFLTGLAISGGREAAGSRPPASAC